MINYKKYFFRVKVFNKFRGVKYLEIRIINLGEIYKVMILIFLIFILLFLFRRIILLKIDC